MNRKELDCETCSLYSSLEEIQTQTQNGQIGQIYFTQNMLDKGQYLDYDNLKTQKKLSKFKLPLVQKKIVKIKNYNSNFQGNSGQAIIPNKEIINENELKQKLKTLKKWSASQSYLNLNQELTKLKTILGRKLYREDILFDLFHSCGYDRLKLLNIMKTKKHILIFEAKQRNQIEQKFNQK